MSIEHTAEYYPQLYAVQHALLTATECVPLGVVLPGLGHVVTMANKDEALLQVHAAAFALSMSNTNDGSIFTYEKSFTRRLLVERLAAAQPHFMEEFAAREPLSSQAYHATLKGLQAWQQRYHKWLIRPATAGMPAKEDHRKLAELFLRFRQLGRNPVIEAVDIAYDDWHRKHRLSPDQSYGDALLLAGRILHYVIDQPPLGDPDTNA